MPSACRTKASKVSRLSVETSRSEGVDDVTSLISWCYIFGSWNLFWLGTFSGFAQGRGIAGRRLGEDERQRLGAAHARQVGREADVDRLLVDQAGGKDAVDLGRGRLAVAE